MKQGSPEWIEARLGIATASRFSDIMSSVKRAGSESASRAGYRTELVCERLTGVPVARYRSKAMDRGTELEPEARAAFEAETGHLVTEVGLIRHPELAAGCSPDGLYLDGQVGLEIKCPLPHTHFQYLTREEVPAEYFWQVQGGLWVTGLKRWTFVSYCPEFPDGMNLLIVEVVRDEEAIAKLAKEVEEFLQSVDEEEKVARKMLARRTAF